MLTKLLEAKAAYDKAVAEIKKDAAKNSVALFAPIFEAHPDIESFSWTQYTPYFNDGDSCTFSAGDIDQVNGYEEYSDEWDAEVSKGYGKDEVKGKLYSGYRAAQTLLASFPDDALEALFGDHVRVTVTRSSVEIEEYDHE